MGTAKTILVLKYAEKQERESFNSIVKVAQGLGATFSPVFITCAIAISGYWLAFVIIAACLCVITPVIHYRLTNVA